MNSVGIDLHRKRSHIAVLDEHGDRGALAADRQRPRRRSSSCSAASTARRKIALEATYGWEWLAELLEDAGYELHLAHPLRTKAIAAARVKTDAVDARTLAHLLRTDLLPEAYIAPRELRDLRDLLRHRVALTRMRSALKNRVARDPGQARHRPPATPTCSAPAAASSSPSSSCARARAGDSTACSSLIGDFDREIDATSREIDQRAKADRPRRGALPDPRRRPLHRDAHHRRGRRHQPLPHRPPPLLLGRADADRPQLRRQGPPRATSPARAPRHCAGHSSRPPSTPPPAAARCASATSGSPNAAAARSPRSRSLARSSPSATTACATERSVAWRPGPRRARSEQRRSPMTRRAMPSLSTPGAMRSARASSCVVMAPTRPTRKGGRPLD